MECILINDRLVLIFFSSLARNLQPELNMTLTDDQTQIVKEAEQWMRGFQAMRAAARSAGPPLANKSTRTRSMLKH